MERVIEIDILDKEDLVEKYNDDRLSKELLDFILKEAAFVGKKDSVKIIVNKKCELENCSSIIRNGLKDEYDKSFKLNHITNIKQFCLLLLGIAFLFLSTLVNEDTIWNELLLIGGWVPIWEVIDIELFSDIEGKRKRVILKKLLSGDIIEK